MADQSSNAISLSLPTDFITGAGNNGLNVHFNFGGNASTIADSAYNFLNTSFNSDKAFLGGAIVSTQNYVSSQTAPLLSTAQNLGTTFTQHMPDIIANLFGAAQNANQVSEQISANSTAASLAASQASIAESNNANQGGGCFITTAACIRMGRPDDCWELELLRRFRDERMKKTEQGSLMVETYYLIAPGYVSSINKREDAYDIYFRMYDSFIIPAANAVDMGDDNEALALYRALVEYARVKAYGA